MEVENSSCPYYNHLPVQKLAHLKKKLLIIFTNKRYLENIQLNFTTKLSNNVFIKNGEQSSWGFSKRQTKYKQDVVIFDSARLPFKIKVTFNISEGKPWIFHGIKEKVVYISFVKFGKKRNVLKTLLPYC